LVPSPGQVGRSLFHLAQSGELASALWNSGRRLLLGYLISLLFGTALGFALAASPWAERSLGTLVTGLQALPSICWLPVALLWFGLSEGAILFLLSLGSI